MVMMLTFCFFTSCKAAYRVVDFPEPVGPVTSNMP